MAKIVKRGMHLSFSHSIILLATSLTCLISYTFIIQSVNADTFIGRNTTNGTSLDVSVEKLSIHFNPELKGLFKVFFFKPHTNTIQQHVDYDFLILKDGKTVFQLSNETSQPQLHTFDGQAEVPILKNQKISNGNYVIKIPIYGILFNPIKPEVSEFKFNTTS
ncbi:MAG TPA: hypothetical protein VH481_04985 [Nitrososphaeraceae archaeon]